MISFRRCLLVVAAAAALLSVTSRAQENDGLTVGLKLDFASKYIWRGIVWTDDAVVKPSVTLGYGGFELSALGIVDTTDAWGREDNFEEVDYTLSYSHPCTEDFTATVGAIYYDYPGNDFGTEGEVFIKGAYHVTLNPVLAIYHGFEDAEGFYVNLAVSHEIGLPSVHENLALILDTNIGWGSSDYNEYWVGTDGSGMANLSPGATLTYTASEALSFSWYARYDYLLDSDVRDNFAFFGIDSSNFSFGANVAYNF